MHSTVFLAHKKGDDLSSQAYDEKPCGMNKGKGLTPKDPSHMML